MKKIKFLSVLLLTIGLGSISQADVKVPRLKAVSTFNHPVIDQSKPIIVAKSERQMLVKRTYIAKWRTQRYEYGEFVFKCGSQKCTPWKNRTVLAMFKSCKGLDKNGEPNCSGRVTSDDGPSEDSNTGNGRHWYSCDDYDQSCRDRRDDVEFPDRHTPVDSEMPSNMPI